MSDLDEILGQYAGFASIAWDEDGVFKTDDILTKTKEVKQAIEKLIEEAYKKGYIDGGIAEMTR